MPESVQKTPLISEGDYTVVEVKELAFFDLTGEKAKTSGTSNKSYHAELQISKNNSDKCQIYTIWGPTGAPNQTKEWRHYALRSKADKDFTTIVKSKIKKGYQEIDVAQRAYGSEAAKAIVKTVVLTNADGLDNSTVPKSKLHNEVQRVVGDLFNITNNWVVTTLRCPLGQLTNTQIDKGRDILTECKSIIEIAPSLSASNKKKIENLTNDFYGAIPHNLGQGARGQMVHLLLDEQLKIAQKSEDLDLLLDAKAAGASLQSTDIDARYRTLNSDMKYVDHNTPVFDWVEKMVLDTRASNHHFLGKIKVHNVFELLRGGEDKVFMQNAERIAKDKPKHFTPTILSKLNSNRPDVNKDLADLYKKANVLPVWHGTRKANVVGITMKGFLIRPAGVVLAGSMYGNGIYKATNSTKSINYCDVKNSYWAGGGSGRGFLFLSDTAFGEPKIATGSYHYSLGNIKGYHSVWAKGGSGGVINDELIVYNPSGPEQQHKVRYLVEFETGAR